MTYAGERLILDADSHLMELPDFLSAHADPGTEDLLPRLMDITTGQFDPSAFIGKPGHDPEVVADLVKLGDGLTRGPKWHAALGAFSGPERTVALDLLGFRAQVVFASFCARPTFEAPPAHRYPIARAHNRAMAAFCQADPRLIGVALIPLDDPDEALKEIDRATALGLGAAWIGAEAPGGRSPGHPDLDPVWRTLAERGLPFILHVGSSSLQIPAPWMNDGHPERRTARGGAEVIGSKDLTVIHHASVRFISALVLDGVLERHPGLRGACVELGAGWVPELLRRLDWVVKHWSRNDANLQGLSRVPSRQMTDQLAFTPFVFEEVGRFIDQSNPDLYLFSSDYPHIEGGRDPIGRFEAALGDRTDAIRQKFYADNFLRIFPTAAG